jgi:hypothetical protein
MEPCSEINGEWNDDYVHLEYWQLGSYFIPARKALFSRAVYDKTERKRFFDLNEYNFPPAVSDLITITKTYEFTGITEFHIRWQALYDEITMYKEYPTHSVYHINNYAYSIMQRAP